VGSGTLTDGSSYCLTIPTTFTAANQTLWGYQLSGAHINLSTVINASGYNGIEAMEYIDTSCNPGGYPGAVIQIGDGTHSASSSWENLVEGSWVWVNLPSTSWGSVNASQINSIQCNVNTGGANGTYGTGNFEIDNVQFY
jgi:hypothetical protein